MTATQKKKLCWNCEGRVSLEEENCPYCAVYLGPAPDESGKQDDLAPPYRIVDDEDEQGQAKEQEEIPPSPYAINIDEVKEGEESSGEELTETRRDLKQIVLPMALLSGGALFFLFGMVLFAFSEEGVLTLTWNAENWYYYFLGSIPMLFFGWRALRNFDTEDVEDSDVNTNDQ